MKPLTFRAATLVAFTLVAGACVPKPKTAPRPTPAPAATAAATAPTPAPSPTYASWMDVPATPGDWTYRFSPAGGTAFFGEASGEPRFSMRCDRAQRAVLLERAGQGTGQVPVTIRSEFSTRAIPSSPVAGAEPIIQARLAVNDPLLDAMALSKGRFAVETPGLPTLYVPAWPEVTRVIEDCRS